MTKVNIKKLGRRHQKLIEEISRLADQSKVSAYLVGGIVRDLLLGRSSKDLDIVTEGDAVSFARQFSAQFKSKLTVYSQFGTSTVELEDGTLVDFATARKEVYLHCGALPQVSKGTIKDDLFRRDFTVNAMAVCINLDRRGELVDSFNGREDLKQKRIRILHQKSFMDDPTRILRAIRFKERFNFQFDRLTLQLLEEALKNDYVRNVKLPRYFAEFRKIFNEDKAVECLISLSRLNGLSFIGKKIDLDIGLLNHIGKAIQTSGKKLKADRAKLRFYAFFDAIRPWEILELSGRLHLTREEKMALTWLKDSKKIFKSLNRQGLKSSQIYRIVSGYSADFIYYLFLKIRTKQIKLHLSRYLSKLRFEKLSVTGHDVRTLGVKDGLKTGRILEVLLNRKMDAGIKGRKMELRELKNVIKKEGVL